MDNSDRLIIAEFPVSVLQRQTDGQTNRQTDNEDIPTIIMTKSTHLTTKLVIR